MILLADENFPGFAIRALRSDGRVIRWIAEEAPGSSDSVVLGLAQENGWVLVTLDKDFGELAFRSTLPASSGVILVRLHDRDPSAFTERLRAVLALELDWPGHFSVVGKDRIRMRPLGR